MDASAGGALTVSSDRREPARTWQGCKDGSPARDRSKTVSMATAVGARGNVEDRSDQPPYEPQSWLDLPLKEVFKRAAEAQREREEQKQRELEPFEELKGSRSPAMPGCSIYAMAVCGSVMIVASTTTLALNQAMVARVANGMRATKTHSGAMWPQIW
jgi:hypothetical protein